MKTGVKIGLIVGGATLLIGGTIFAVVKLTKKDEANNIGGGNEKTNAEFIFELLGKDKTKTLWDLAWWYKNKGKSTNPIGSAMWDMDENRKELSKDDRKKLMERGVTYEDLEQASKL